jgi:hypothetical protein
MGLKLNEIPNTPYKVINFTKIFKILTGRSSMKHVVSSNNCIVKNVLKINVLY